MSKSLCRVEVISQVKAPHELESYGPYKQADARSAANQRAHSLLESTRRHISEQYLVGMLCAVSDPAITTQS